MNLVSRWYPQTKMLPLTAQAVREEMHLQTQNCFSQLGPMLPIPSLAQGTLAELAELAMLGL